MPAFLGCHKHQNPKSGIRIVHPTIDIDAMVSGPHRARVNIQCRLRHPRRCICNGRCWCQREVVRFSSRPVETESKSASLTVDSSVAAGASSFFAVTRIHNTGLNKLPAIAACAAAVPTSYWVTSVSLSHFQLFGQRPPEAKRWNLWQPNAWPSTCSVSSDRFCQNLRSSFAFKYWSSSITVNF